MIIIGIDPGIAATGYGVLKKTPQGLETLNYGVIQTMRHQKPEQRLRKLYAQTAAILKKYKPDVLAIERLFFFKNTKTAMAVSEARGVILLTAAQKKIEIQEYTPLAIKMGICGYGRADKKQVQRMVKEILGFSEIPKPDDAADGLAIAICCAYANNNQTTNFLRYSQLKTSSS